MASAFISLPVVTADDVLLQRRSMVVHERRSNAPHEFIIAGSAEPDTVMHFQIGLRSADVNGLEKALYDVSIPGSPLYGQHISFDEVGLNMFFIIFRN